MYKSTEFAKLIGVHPNTLRKWHKDGLLIPFRVVNKVRYYSQEQYEKFKKGEI